MKSVGKKMLELDRENWTGDSTFF